MIRAWDPLLAIEFLTIARFRRFQPMTAEALARSQAFYPLVGLGLGGMLVVLDLLLRDSLPAGALAAGLLAALALATRGLHLDGLADTFDGLLGGSNPQRRLEIMRDPRIGSFGATTLVLTLLLKWSAIAALAGSGRWPALLVAPSLARFAMVVTAAAMPYARSTGLGRAHRAAARGWALAIATVTAVLIAVAACGAFGLALVAMAVGIALGVGVWATWMTGGVTGDVYGAVCELSETALLLASAGLAAHGWAVSGLVAG